MISGADSGNAVSVLLCVFLIFYFILFIYMFLFLFFTPNPCFLISYLLSLYGVSNRVDAPKDRFMSVFSILRTNRTPF